MVETCHHSSDRAVSNKECLNTATVTQGARSGCALANPSPHPGFDTCDSEAAMYGREFLHMIENSKLTYARSGRVDAGVQVPARSFTVFRQPDTPKYFLVTFVTICMKPAARPSAVRAHRQALACVRAPRRAPRRNSSRVTDSLNKNNCSQSWGGLLMATRQAGSMRVKATAGHGFLARAQRALEAPLVRAILLAQVLSLLLCVMGRCQRGLDWSGVVVALLCFHQP